MKKALKVIEENSTGRNTKFINENSGRTFSAEQVIQQIENGNPTYEDYHVVEPKNGEKYVRSNPDNSSKNNLE